MRLSESIKPIDFFESNTAELLRQVHEEKKSFILTQNGEAKVIVQDIREYEEMKESLALLKIMALGEQAIEEGRTKSAEKIFEELEMKIEDHSSKQEDPFLNVIGTLSGSIVSNEEIDDEITSWK